MADDAPDERGFNNITGARHARMTAGLARVTADNARRVQCSSCTLTILPEDMDRHMAIIHSEEDE